MTCQSFSSGEATGAQLHYEATGIDVTKMKMSSARCVTPEKAEKRAQLRIHGSNF
jgi:hypothetical protein